MGLRGRQLGVFTVVAMISLPVIAQAREREIEYRSVAGCPPAAEVVRAIAGRASEGRAARITIDRSGVEYRGELVLGDGEGKLTRTVAGRSCAAVVDALALVVALDEERDASGDAKANADANASAEANASAKADADVAPRAADATAVGGDAVAGVTRKALVEVSAGIAISGMGFARGEVLPGASLFGDVAWGRALFDVAWFRPSMRVGFGRTLDVTTPGATLSTHFQLTAGSLEACPIGARLGTERLTVVGCARGDLGALDAEAGSGSGYAQTRLWASAGGTARIRLALGKPGSLQPMFEAGGGLLAPLVRDRFYVQDEPAVRAPAMLWTASIGGGLVFP